MLRPATGRAWPSPYVATSATLGRYFGALRAFVDCSNAYAILNNTGSLHARPKNDTPTGSPIAKPAGHRDVRIPRHRGERRAAAAHAVAIDEIGDPGRRAGRREERIEPVRGHHGVDPLGARDAGGTWRARSGRPAW